MPRRKYGRLQKTIPPVKEDKCRFCRLGWHCPVHRKGTIAHADEPKR